MGMPGARQYVKTCRLDPAGDQTIVRTSGSKLGDIGADRLTGWRAELWRTSSDTESAVVGSATSESG